MESNEGLQFPDRPAEEETGPPGPAERRIENRDPAGDEDPAEERAVVIKKPRAEESDDSVRG